MPTLETLDWRSGSSLGTSGKQVAWTIAIRLGLQQEEGESAKPGIPSSRDHRTSNWLCLPDVTLVELISQSFDRVVVDGHQVPPLSGFIHPVTHFTFLSTGVQRLWDGISGNSASAALGVFLCWEMPRIGQTPQGSGLLLVAPSSQVESHGFFGQAPATGVPLSA